MIDFKKLFDPKRILEKLKSLALKLGVFLSGQLKLMPGRIRRASRAFGKFCFTHAPVIAISLTAVLSAGVLLLVPLKAFYKDRLALGTWINGIYVTGYDREMLVEKMNEVFPKSELTVYLNKSEFTVRFADYVSEYDFTDPVDEIFEEQDSTPFFKLFLRKDYHLSPKMVLMSEITDLWKEETKDKVDRDYNYYYSGWTGTFVEENSLCQVFDRKKAYEAFKAAMINTEEELDLRGDEFFYEVEPDYGQKKKMEEFEKLNAFQNAGITYDMGEEKIVLSPKQMCNLLVIESGYPMVNEKGAYVISQEKISSLVEELFEPYNTISKDREFQTVTGTMILTNSDEYGTEINMRAEENYLNYAVKKAVSGDFDIPVRVPVYNLTANNRGLNDIGYDYIEVDIESQKLYVVSGGECEFECDIVSGKDRYATPHGLFTISDMQKDRFLVQYNYNVFVQYRIILSNGISITDALWRDVFGTEDYHENGSSGNIELAPEAAKEVFEYAGNGMPVIIYGEDEIIK